MAKPRFIAENPQIFGKTNKSTRRTLQKMIFQNNVDFTKSRIGKKTQSAILKGIESQDPKMSQYSHSNNLLISLTDIRGVPNRRKITKTIRKQAFVNPNHLIRLEAIRYLAKLKTPSARRALKKAIFDTDRAIRHEALQAVVKNEGYLSAIREIHKIFPIGCPPIDEYFFHNKYSPRIDTSNTTFMGYYRGAPIVMTTKESHKILEKEEGGIPNMGLYKDGKLIINGDVKILPKEFRQIVIAHEFGEYWGHELGLATMLLEAKRSGKLQKFWNFIKDKPFDFVKEQQLQKLIAAHPYDFKGFEKYFK